MQYGFSLTLQVLSVTDDAYVGFTLDFSLKVNPSAPWYSLNFSNPRVKTLAEGLAPADLRFGGTTCDFSRFYNVSSKREQDDVIRLNAASVDHNRKKSFLLAIFPQDVDHLVALARQAGGRLIYDLSIQMRYGPQWDASNARTLMRYMIERGYATDVDFELGNEPPYKSFTSAAFHATGERIAQDFKVLRQVMDYFPEFRGSRLIGPDVETPRDGGYSGEQPTIMKDFVTHIGNDTVSAVTAHHYYFTGPTAHIAQFYDLKYVHLLQSTLPKLRDVVYSAAGGPVDLWIGETADSNLGGTRGITDRYASGFLWLDKLGLCARNGFKKVIRQTFYGYNNTANYPLLNTSLYPNPDYWLTHVYKRLVGRGVFDVIVDGSNETVEYLRVYAHCASPRSGYAPGSLVLYAINLHPNLTASIGIDNAAPHDVMDAYVMTPVDGELTSPYVQLNGKTLAMVDDHTLPSLVPREVPVQGFTLQPLTYAFLVLKNQTTKLCSVAEQHWNRP